MYSIRSLDDLFRSAVNSEELIGHTKLLLADIEHAIILALQSKQRTVRFSINQHDFYLESFTPKEAVKILVYNVVRAMSEKKYTVKVSPTLHGYDLHITLIDFFASS